MATHARPDGMRCGHRIPSLALESRLERLTSSGTGPRITDCRTAGDVSCNVGPFEMSTKPCKGGACEKIIS